jgi:hypothetical protein
MSDLDGGENVGDQLDLPAGGCQDGAVAITEGDRTPRAAAPSFRAERCSYVCQGLGLFGDPISVVPGEMMFRRSLLGADRTGKGHSGVKGRLL